MSENLQSTEQSAVLRKLNDIANWVTALRGEISVVIDYIEDQRLNPPEIDEN